MTLHPAIAAVTDRIRARSRDTRSTYLDRMRRAADAGTTRAHLSCGNQAHAYAAMGADKDALVAGRAPNIGIVTAYNDMLSAHQPYERYPDLIRAAARRAGATAQVAGGVPAMCDGVTQGQTGMELSLFSRDVIALAAGVSMSHNVFDAALYLGVCDKIVPGLIMAAATFGHVPAVFVPAGPMTSGIPNDEKSKVRNDFAQGLATRDQLMVAEMAAYHGPGTCTFYGTANTNQMLMEFMGLHLPGAAFVNPGTPLREALTTAAVERAAAITALGNDYRPAGEILDERAFVNGIVGLMATGGSTNLVLHIPAMARAAGVLVECEDFAAISDAVPLMAKVYPNGLADVNHFHAAGGIGFLIGELLGAGLLHPDTKTIAGDGLARYAQEPKLRDGALVWEDGAAGTLNDRIVRPAADPFSRHRRLEGTARQSRTRRDEGVRRRARTPHHRSARPHLPRPARGQGRLQARRVHERLRGGGAVPGAASERHARTAFADPHAVGAAGPRPARGAGHRRAHVRRVRQGSRGDPCQPRGRLRRPAGPPARWRHHPRRCRRRNAGRGGRRSGVAHAGQP